MNTHSCFAIALITSGVLVAAYPRATLTLPVSPFAPCGAHTQVLEYKANA